VSSSGSGQNESFILLGTVARPHGIRGELKVRPFTEKPGNFCLYRRLFFSAENGHNKIEYNNVQTRVNGNTVILRLNECTDRDRAEQLVGMQIWLASCDLPPVEADEFYLHALEGKRVRTATGQELGTVSGLLSSVQDVLIIRDDGDGEYLVPAVREFIVAIEETEIVLDLPPGLLEINR
jgi:16S rRNA processing protein RimM